MAVEHTSEMYAEHRKRMRERIVRKGTDSLEDVKLLEVFLFEVLPRIDTYPIAYNLIKRFGSLDKVFSASAEELETVDGVGEKTAFFISLAGSILDRTGEGFFSSYKLDSYEAAYAYLNWLFKNEREDTTAVIFLDEKGNIISTVKYPALAKLNGRINKDIEKTAAENKAARIIVSHKHPKDCTEPSAEDIVSTDTLYRLCREMGVTLEDHLIISGNRIIPIIERVTGEKSAFFSRAE